MTFVYISLVLAAIAALVVCYVRVRTGTGSDSLLLRRVGIGASLAFSSLLVCIVLGLVLYVAKTARLSVPMNDWPTYVLIGATLPPTVFVLVNGVLLSFGSCLARWACRTPSGSAQSASGRLGETLVTMLIVSTAGALAMSIAFCVDRFGSPLLVVPLCFAAVPLVPTFVTPWLQYAKAPGLRTSDNSLNEWLANVRKLGRVRRLDVRVQEGAEANAYALRTLGRHLIVVGGGLVSGMSPSELKAVLAHEVAHVVNRDVSRRLLPLSMFGAFGLAASIAYLGSPLFATNEPLGIVGGGLTAGLATLVFNILIPGFFMKRMELRADRLAVELLGDPLPMESALRRLAELNDEPLEAKSWSHPSYQARIDAIRMMPNRPPQPTTP